MSNPVDIASLLSLLESQEIATSKEVGQLILDNLTKIKEAWLVYGLVDHYMKTQSSRSLDILAKVTEPNDRKILDRILEYLRGQHRLQGLMLLGHLVRMQTPWMHKIVHHQVLGQILKIIKTEVDVPIIMSAVLLITALLPFMPVSIAQYLQEIFDGFSRLAAFNLKKPGDVPDVYMVHLQVGIYSLFHRLYGMYPCHFLTYLRANYSKKENGQVFEQTIMPMLQRVRMHPMLVTATKDKEISRERWKHLDVQDIVIDCAKLSLDLIEGTREYVQCPIFYALQRTNFVPQKAFSERWVETLCVPDITLNPADMSSNLDQNAVIGKEVNPPFNPLVSFGLDTPPPTTPGSGTGILTSPVKTMCTPAADPTYMLEIDTQQTTEAVNHQKMSLTLSDVPTLPQKSELLVKPPQMLAIRKIDFQDSAKPPLNNQNEKSLDKEHANSECVNTFLESAAADFPECHKDSAVRMVCEEPKKTSPKSSSDLQAKNKLEDNDNVSNTNFIDIPGKKNESDQHSHSVPSVLDLPGFIESLDNCSTEGNFAENSDNDDEVSALTESPVEDGSFSAAMDTYPQDANLTAESVQQFMKNMNRIRFNSMNVNSKEKVDRSEISKSYFRPNSCPDLNKKTIYGIPIRIKDGVTDNTNSGNENCISAQMEKECNHDQSDTEYVVDSDTTKKGPPSHFTHQPKKEDIGACFPYTHLFPMAVPIAPFMQCYNCLSGGKNENFEDMLDVNSIGVSKTDVHNASMASPSELLYKHINFGRINHANIVEGRNTSLKNDGTDIITVSDDCVIGQLLLLHNQLTYEQHKREMYARRNRRLLSRIVKTTALEEQTVAMKDQLILQENEIQKLSVSSKMYQDEKAKLQTKIDELLFAFDELQRNCMNDSELLKIENRELNTSCEKLEKENDALFKELHITKNQLFNMGNEIKSLKTKADVALELQSKIGQLNKELLLMGELQQKYQQRLVGVSSKENSNAESSLILDSLNDDLRNLKLKFEEKTVLYDVAINRINAMEDTLKMKEVVISDLVNQIEDQKEYYEGQMQGCDLKYKNQRKIQQALQGQILQLKAEINTEENYTISESKDS